MPTTRARPPADRPPRLRSSLCSRHVSPTPGGYQEYAHRVKMANASRIMEGEQPNAPNYFVLAMELKLWRLNHTQTNPLVKQEQASQAAASHLHLAVAISQSASTAIGLPHKRTAVFPTCAQQVIVVRCPSKVTNCDDSVANISAQHYLSRAQRGSPCLSCPNSLRGSEHRRRSRTCTYQTVQTAVDQ